MKAAAIFFVGGVVVPEQEAIDPYELIDAVEILSKLPKDFFENLVSTQRVLIVTALHVTILSNIVEPPVSGHPWGQKKCVLRSEVSTYGRCPLAEVRL